MEEGLKVSFLGDLSPLRAAFKEAAQGVKDTSNEINRSIATIGKGVRVAPIKVGVEVDKIIPPQLPKGQEMKIPVTLVPPKSLPPLSAASLKVESVIIPPKLPDVKVPKLEINVNTTPGVKSLQQLQDQLKRFKDALKTSTDPQGIARLNRAIDATEGRIKDISSIRDPFKGVTKGSNQALNSLTDVSRIIQDMPYGIRGIANNLNPAVESFSRLKVETGSTKAAFSALASSLLGPAGIAMGVSIVSSLLVSYGDKLFAAKSKTNLFKDTIAEAAKSVGEQVVKLEIFKKKLNDTNLSSADRVKIAKEYNAIADETNKIDLKQIDNLTLINQKIDAQNKLIQQRALSAAALSKLTEASNKLIENELKLQTALQASGLTYKQLEEAADKAFKKQMEGTQAVRRGLDGIQTNKPFIDGSQENKIDGVSNALISLFREVKSGRYEFDKLTDSLKGFITIEGLTTKSGQKDPKGPKQRFNFLDDYFDFDPNSAKLSEEQKSKLIDAINKFSDQFGEVLEGADFRKRGNTENQMLEIARQWWGDFQKGVIKLKPPKITIDFEKDAPQVIAPADVSKWAEDYRQSLQQQFDKSLGEPIEVNPAIIFDADKAQILKQYERAFKELGKKLPKDIIEINPNTGDPIKLEISGLNDLERLSEGLKKLLEDAQANIKETAAAVNSVLTPAFQSMFNAIANGEQPLHAFFESVKQSIMQLMAQLMAAAAQALILSALTGGSTSFGKAFSQILGAQKFAKGGIISGPTLGWIGEYAGAKNNPEVVAPLNKLRGMIAGTGGGNVTVTGRLRGGDIILSNNRTARKQKGRR